jgi:hypothetical protein
MFIKNGIGLIPASGVSTDTSNFDNLLSSADETVQDALDTLNNGNFEGGTMGVGEADTTAGTITAHGNNDGQGGKLVLKLAGNKNASKEDYTINVSDTNLLFGPSTDPDSLKYDGETDSWEYTSSGGLIISGGALQPQYGLIVVGVNDTTPGTVTCFGGAATEAGGTLNIYNAADQQGTTDNYAIKVLANTDDLLIGPASDPDSLLYDLANGYWEFTGSGIQVGTGTGYVNFSTTGGSGGYGVRDNSGVIEHKHSGGDWSRTSSYVDRGDPSSTDKEVGDFTTDGTWVDLDLSAIVPTGATRVKFRITIQDGSVNQVMQFRENGNSNAINRDEIRTQVADLDISDTFTIDLDANRIIEYKGTNTTFTKIALVVRGWYI